MMSVTAVQTLCPDVRKTWRWFCHLYVDTFVTVSPPDSQSESRVSCSPAVCRLDPHAVVNLVFDSVLCQRLQDGVHRREARQILVRHQTDVSSSEVLQVLQENRRTAPNIYLHTKRQNESQADCWFGHLNLQKSCSNLAKL